MEKILKLNIPQISCVNEIVPYVYMPIVNGFTVSTDTDNTNWPISNAGDFITIGSNHYNFKHYGTGVSNPTLTPFDPINKTFGTTKEIDLIVYGSIPIIGTDKLYFYGGKLKVDSLMTNRLFSYDPSTEQITEIGTGGGLGRWGGCGCQMGNKIFVFSGTNSDNVYLSAFTEIDLTNGTFTNLATTPDPRSGGSLIKFNDLLYLTGYTYCNNGANGRKIWTYSDVTKTWTDTTYSTPVDIEAESKWIIINNELCLFNTSTMTSNIEATIFKFIPGTGFTKIFGTGLGQDLTTTDIVFDKFISVFQYDSVVWFYAWLSNLNNACPTEYLIGRVDLSSNTLINEFYPIHRKSCQIDVSVIQSEPKDTPQTVFFRCYGDDSSLQPNGYTEVSQPYENNRTTFNDRNRYVILQPSNIKVGTATKVQVAYKTVKSSQGPWSNIFEVNGGGGE